LCVLGKFENSDTGMRVRVASEADAAAIASIINAAFAIETFIEGMRTDARRVAQMMRLGDFLTALDRSEQIVASVYVEARAARGYFGMLAVDPMYQGKGFGARMVRAAEDYCRERACKAMDITVLSLRLELLPFYHRLGYQESGKEEFHPARPLKAGASCYSILLSKSL
jgi:GNAT superfamily N-acetyltransferase